MNTIIEEKGYNELKENVEYWYKQTNDDRPIIQGSYEIVFDNEIGWCVDVDGHASFDGTYIKEIPFQFRNVSGHFSCSNCKNLTSLKGCPKEVGWDFYCYNCGKKFTEEYVQSLCNVKGQIYN